MQAAETASLRQDLSKKIDEQNQRKPREAGFQRDAFHPNHNLQVFN
jgi:hypothetical protein